MPIVGSYNHLHLVSPDPDAAAEWYVKFLGAEIFRKEELRGSRNIRMTLGGADLYIRGPRPTDNVVETGGAASPTGSTTSASPSRGSSSCSARWRRRAGR